MIFTTFTIMAVALASTLTPSSSMPLLVEETSTSRHEYSIIGKDNNGGTNTMDKTSMSCFCNVAECLVADGSMKLCKSDLGCFMEVDTKVAGGLFGCQELLPTNATCVSAQIPVENVTESQATSTSSPVQTKEYSCCSTDFCNSIVVVQKMTQQTTQTTTTVEAIEVDIGNVGPQNNTDSAVTDAIIQTTTPMVEVLKKTDQIGLMNAAIIAFVSKYESLLTKKTETAIELENMTTTSVDGLESDKDVTTPLVTATGMPNGSDTPAPVAENNSTVIGPAIPTAASMSVPCDADVTTKSGSTDELSMTTLALGTSSKSVDTGTTTGNADSTTTSATSSPVEMDTEKPTASIDTSSKPIDTDTTMENTDSTTTSATSSPDQMDTEKTSASIDTSSKPVDTGTTTGNADYTTTSANSSPDQMDTEKIPASTEISASEMPMKEEIEEIVPKPEKCLGHRRKRHVVRKCITTEGPTEEPDIVKKVMLITPNGEKVDRWSRCIHHVPIYPDICI